MSLRIQYLVPLLYVLDERLPSVIACRVDNRVLRTILGLVTFVVGIYLSEIDRGGETGDTTMHHSLEQ